MTKSLSNEKTITIIKEWVNADNYRVLRLRGISELVQDEERVYGLFVRVKGGVEYSAENDEYFDDLFTDDLNTLINS